MPGMQQVPCLRYLVQLPISYRNSQLLSSVKLPGIDKGLVRDFNLAQIIGLRWNLLPISFRLASTNTWSLILQAQQAAVPHGTDQGCQSLLIHPDLCVYMVGG